MDIDTESVPFLRWLESWLAERPALPLDQLVAEAGGPGNIALLSVDMINGFCTEGPLASPRVQAIVAPITRLMTAAHAAGVRDFALIQDSHPADAPEFAHFPAHCIEGTREAETVPEFLSLPFAAELSIFPKRSLGALVGTNLDAWLRDRPHLKALITVGDCTDLCTYQLALGLKLRANAAGEHLRVILPVDCADTYDLPLALAQDIGALPHPGDTLHAVFLYHMALNGVEVVKSVA